MIEILTRCLLPQIIKMLTLSYPMRYGIVETVSMTGPRWNTLHKLNYVSLVQQLGVMADRGIKSTQPSKIPPWMLLMRDWEIQNISQLVCGAEISQPPISIRQVKSFPIWINLAKYNVLFAQHQCDTCRLFWAQWKELSTAKIPTTPHIQTWDRNSLKVRNAELWGTGDNAYMYSSLVQGT